tara:strand:- start:178 stop:360 length:183 start_codon:yes stop_codon:yes gene_type:complete
MFIQLGVADGGVEATNAKARAIVDDVSRRRQDDFFGKDSELLVDRLSRIGHRYELPRHPE